MPNNMHKLFIFIIPLMIIFFGFYWLNKSITIPDKTIFKENEIIRRK